MVISIIVQKSKKTQFSRKKAQTIWYENADRGRVSRPKSVWFGLGSDLHRTNKLNRLNILLLLATLTHWFSMMLGAVIDKAGKTGALQPKTGEWFRGHLLDYDTSKNSHLNYNGETT
ncbi:hypothetical protein CWC19_02415 [Pseudoalteromonas aurantia]|uniref:Uncharacterized protein n=1 Tax=Pseudoalteromonas aurantia TaxID=43654 RepID=A0A5S3VDK9_9GAMM|nr:hypothetical protein CWC19_02415 [Pseudoalteromonas aurantia]